MGRYRILAGSHKGPDISGNVVEIQAARQGRVANDIIETEQDLESLNGPPGFSRKFERLHDGANDEESLEREINERKAKLDKLRGAKTVPAAQPKSMGDKNLDKMSDKELQAFADSSEIDLGKAATKAEMIAVIKKAMGS